MAAEFDKNETTLNLLSKDDELAHSKTDTAHKALKLFKNPAETVLAIGEFSVKKASMSWHRVLVLAILAGIYVSFGGAVSIMATGGLTRSNTSFIRTEMPGLARVVFGATFPIGLVMVIVLGTELFTGNTMTMTLGVMAQKISIRQLLINWGLSYVGNFIGCVLMAVLFWGCNSYSYEPYLSFLQYYASYKVLNYSWGVLFLKAIPCNVLVTTAVYMATSAEDIVGKIMAIYPTIFTFVVLGLEHSIANMFMIPVGIFYGASVTFIDFLWMNLLPVTLGNIVGAVLVLALPQWYVYYTAPAPKQPDRLL